MRVALFGAVQASLAALRALQAPSITLRAFGLSPERAARHADYADLAAAAAVAGVEASSVTDINAPAVADALRQWRPDFICVFGWSQLVRAEFLSLAKHGVLGWHPSLLPENRGRAVIPWTILQDRRESGFSIFWLDEGMDSGDIAARVRVPVAADETAATLYAKMERAAGEALKVLVPRLMAGELPRTPQDHSRASYCAKREPADGMVRWSDFAAQVARLVRAAGAPYAGAFTEHRGRQIILLDAEECRGTSYWGIPGQVQWIDAQGVIVKCGGGTDVRIKSVMVAGGAPESAQTVLGMHERLGTGRDGER